MSALFGLLVCLLGVSALGGCAGNSAFVLSAGGRAMDGTDQSTEMPVESGTETDMDSEERFVYVHVCGAVKEPGLKRLPEGSRVWDALESAGGFTDEADSSAVNLAAVAEDGQQLYFPVVGEEIASQEEPDGRINLNTADEQQLCTLPGIGSSRAQAILKYRKDNGKFAAPEELMQVPGIKEAIYEQICDKITVK